MKAYFFICSALLYIALADLTIGYFTFLRISVSIGGVLAILDEFDGEINFWVIIFGIITILFNPIDPVYLGDKESWVIPDLIGGTMFLIKGLRTQSKSK